MPPVEIATWASVWSEAVAVNEMCVKNGESGHGRPQSKCSVLVKPHFLPTRHYLAFLRSQPLSVVIDDFHQNAQRVGGGTSSAI